MQGTGTKGGWQSKQGPTAGGSEYEASDSSKNHWRWAWGTQAISLQESYLIY